MKELKYKGYDSYEFNVKVTMNKRWVPHFLGMLKTMERLGGLGSSREITFYSDGDGDYRPKFEWDDSLPKPAKPLQQEEPGQSPRDCGYDFDAG